MEIWIDAVGYPSHEVSSYGRIRNKHTGHILKQYPDRYGYMRLSLGSKDNVSVHRVVCESFHGSPEIGREQVNHIDGDRANNCADNLEWCSARENIIWGIYHGNIDPSIGLKKAVDVNQRPVRIVDLGLVFKSTKLCAEYLNVPPTNVTRCLRGARKGQKLHGYQLEYA